MHDIIRFNNQINYKVVGPQGEIISQGFLPNAQTDRNKWSILATLKGTNSYFNITALMLRLDGSAILGSRQQWEYADSSGTAISTMWLNGTGAVPTLMFTATYTATANVSCKAVALVDGYSMNSSDTLLSYGRFYSTNLNLAVGSSGKIIVNWTITTI